MKFDDVLALELSMHLDFLTYSSSQILRPEILLVNNFEGINLLALSTTYLIDEGCGAAAQLPHDLVV